jgi:hypothetical protein
MDELAYYRRHSQLTDPGAKQHLFSGLPADAAGMAEVIGGVMVHRDQRPASAGIDQPCELQRLS